MLRSLRRMTADAGPTVFSALLAPLVAAGCANLYTPNTVPSPLPDRRGDVHAGMHYAVSGLDAEAAVAVTDALGLGGAFSTDAQHDDRGRVASHTYGEGMLIYHHRFPRNPKVAAMAGAGFGGVSFMSDDGLLQEGTMRKLFVQGTIGTGTAHPGTDSTTDPVIEAGASLRISRVDFPRLDASGSAIDYRVTTFLEPAVFFRAYYGHVGFGGELNTSKPLGTWPEYRHLDLSVAMSVLVRFGL